MILRKLLASLLLLVALLPTAALATGAWPTPVFGNYAQRVASNAALSLLAINQAVKDRGAHKDGFYAAGDGGDADYRYAPGACPLNAGAGDGGSQVPASDGSCFLLQPEASGVSTAVFGAVCNAQVLYDFMLVTAGSGGTRQVTLGGTPAIVPQVGFKIEIAIGGASAGAAWRGVVASVVGTTNVLVTVTAPPGTAIGTPTYGVIQWGRDNYNEIVAAVAALSGVARINIPGQCGVSQRITMNAQGASMHGMIGPPGHHDNTTPSWSPPAFAGFVWLGGPDIMFNQTSVSGLSNFETKYQNVDNLAFFGGNAATVGRSIATVANSKANNLYAADATQQNFSWGVSGATSLGEAAGTCYLDETDLWADGLLYGAVDYFFSGASVTLPAPTGLSPWDFCASHLHNLNGTFKDGDGIRDVFADHNWIENVTLISAGDATTAFSIHLSSIGAGASQAERYTRVGVGGLLSNNKGQIKIEGNATAAMFDQLDTYDPPAGWSLIIGNTNPISCTTDEGVDCAPVPIANLPTCNARLVNKQYHVNNAIASPTYRQLVSTTGSATAAVACIFNGSAYQWMYTQ